MNKIFNPLWIAVFWAVFASGIFLYGRAAGVKSANTAWQAEISRLNAEAAHKTAAQREQALAAEQRAQDRQAALEQELTEMENENAKIEQNSAAACGISAAHVGLLNRQAGAEESVFGCQLAAGGPSGLCPAAAPAGAGFERGGSNALLGA